MNNISKEFIIAGTLNAQENTWKNRFNSVLPDFHKEGEKIIMTRGNNSAEIDPFDEIILTVLLKFLFIPVWLVKQFYNKWMITGLENPQNKIDDWIKLGLVWEFGSPTGLYLRPTWALFKLFGQSPEKFYGIPYNTLAHTVSEEQVFFDILTGYSTIVNNEKKIGNLLLPRISELGFKDDNRGTNVITEPDFRNPYLYQDKGIKELNDTEHRINEAMKNGEKFTPELENFNQFTLVKKINNTGNIKKDFKFHLPDLIIPNLRDDKGNPTSIAVEVELSNKRGGYLETMERYKNNNKFGSVYWLVDSNAIAKSLRDAYKQTKGTGTCKTYIMEFVVPCPDF